MQTDLEEAKGHEIIKLQNSLQAMQSKLDETNELLVNEREAARKAIEEAPPVIKETPVIVQDTEKIDSLIAEVQQLKVIELKPLKVPSMSGCLSSFIKDVYFRIEVSLTYCILNLSSNLESITV